MATMGRVLGFAVPMQDFARPLGPELRAEIEADAVLTSEASGAALDKLAELAGVSRFGSEGPVQRGVLVVMGDDGRVRSHTACVIAEAIVLGLFWWAV